MPEVAMMSMESLLQLLISALAIGSVYAMVAIGYNIIYSATGIINLAQGEFMMFGALVTATASTTWGFPLPLAVITAVILTAVLGILMERLTISPLKNPSVLALIIITIGVSFTLKGAALYIWGEGSYWLPGFFEEQMIAARGEDVFRIFGLAIKSQEIVIWIVLALLVTALTLFFNRTLVGKAMRACSFNRTAARLVGINSRMMVMLAFALSAGIGGLAGAILVAMAPIGYLSGGMLGLKGFSAAVLGGLGNNVGAVVAGLLLAAIEQLMSGFISPEYKNAVGLGVLLIILFVRPSGLFGNKSLSKLSEF